VSGLIGGYKVYQACKHGLTAECNKAARELAEGLGLGSLVKGKKLLELLKGIAELKNALKSDTPSCGV